jgi:membrane protein DedA with SNARE-associated domain
VSSVLPVALMALAGVLVGGAWSLHKQGAARGAVVMVAVLALVALAGGILWLIPGDG